MAFWGIEVKQGTPFVHQYDDENGRLHISQATIVPGSSNKRSVVQCTVGDKKPIYLCSLLPEKLETCPLNLDFEEEDEVTFTVTGPNPVHLSGFFYGEEEEQGNPCCDDDDSDDSYGEEVMLSDSEDEDGSSFDFVDEDDDIGLIPTKAANSGVRIEEIVEDEKPASEKDNSKQAIKKKSKNENSNKQIVVKSGSDVPVMESEDEDGFPISKGANKSDTLKSASRTEEKKDASAGVKTAEKKENEGDSLRKLKRKLGAVIQDEEPTGDNNEARESSAQPDSTTPLSETKQKKKNKKKKVEEKEVNVANSNGAGNSPAATNDMKQTSETKKEKKKKNKKEESVATPSSEEKNSKKVPVVEKKEKTNAKATQERTYPNGLKIEELSMGKPDGRKASKGSKIGVRYIGKLQKNGKTFDSNIGGKPFSFRLGTGQVIAGWDVGVEGMRIGDKRRITIPPAMGYGHKGSPPVIPGNAWLVFDVELVEVN